MSIADFHASSKLPDAIKHLEQAGLEVIKNISIADLDDRPGGHLFVRFQRVRQKGILTSHGFF
jgi:hypothetical protein